MVFETHIVCGLQNVVYLLARFIHGQFGGPSGLQLLSLLIEALRRAVDGVHTHIDHMWHYVSDRMRLGHSRRGCGDIRIAFRAGRHIDQLWR